MKRIFYFLFFLLDTYTSFSQYKTNIKNNFAVPLQIDSSDIYIIGNLIDKANQAKYAISNFNVYDIRNTPFWGNITVYNSKTEEAKKLFQDSLVLVYSLYSGIAERNIFEGGVGKYIRGSVVYENYIIIVAKTDNYNKDGIIDDEDPVHIFICSKDGKKIIQVTPDNMNVLSFKPSRDMKMLLINAQEDKDGDKRFNNENESIFRISIDKNLAKIDLRKLNL